MRQLPLAVMALCTLACGGLGSEPVVDVPVPSGGDEGLPPEPGEAPPPPVATPSSLGGESAGLGWVDQYQRPAVADVDGDGVDDLIALYMHKDDPRIQIHVGAFSGKDLTKLWSHGPIGEREKDVRDMGVSVARGKVVLQEPFGHVRVLEAKSGEEVAEFQLDEVPSWARMCAPVGDETEVNIDQQLLIDLDTLQSRPAGRRSGERCFRSGKQSRKYAGDSTEGAKTHAMAEEKRNVLYRWTDEYGVRLEPPQAGAPEPTLVGYDPASNEERWRMPLATATTEMESWRDEEPDHLDIIGDKVVVVYVPEEGFFPSARVVAIDADIGRVRFDVPIHAGSMWTKVTLTPTHAYVVGIKWPAPPVTAVDLRTGTFPWVFGG